MTSPLRIALFDCDGTLVDSQHSIVAAMAAAFTAFDLQPPDAMQTRRVIGLSLDEAIARLMPEECRRDPLQLAAVYKQTFRENRPDRKSAVSGKRVSVRVDFGGRPN